MNAKTTLTLFLCLFTAISYCSQPFNKDKIQKTTPSTVPLWCSAGGGALGYFAAKQQPSVAIPLAISSGAAIVTAWGFTRHKMQPQEYSYVATLFTMADQIQNTELRKIDLATAKKEWQKTPYYKEWQPKNTAVAILGAAAALTYGATKAFRYLWPAQPKATS